MNGLGLPKIPYPMSAVRCPLRTSRRLPGSYSYGSYSYNVDGPDSPCRVDPFRLRHQLPALALLLVAWILVLASTLATSPILAGPQQYVPGGPQTGPEYILDRLRQVLPGDWQVTAESGNRAPSRWQGAADAYYFRLEDTSTTIQHPDGFPYHPFVKLFFCPPHWSGRMEESDFYADLAPSLLLGKNHDYNVFYQTRGHLTWDDPWTALATTFDLTRPRVDEASG